MPTIEEELQKQQQESAQNTDGVAPVETPVVAPPVQPTSADVSNDPNVIAARQEYDNALRRKEEVENERAQSLRDLINTYRPETPEEKASRERNERIRENIAAATSMGAALANLGMASYSGRGGRSVAVGNAPEAVGKSIDKNRTLLRERDAKGIELRNRYLTARESSANNDVRNAGTNYRFVEAEATRRKKAEEDAKLKQKEAEDRANKANKDRDASIERERIRQNGQTNRTIISQNAATERSNNSIAAANERNAANNANKNSKTTATPVVVGGRDYNIEDKTLKNNVESLASSLPGKDSADSTTYYNQFREAKTISNKIAILNQYLEDPNIPESDKQKVRSQLEHLEELSKKPKSADDSLNWTSDDEGGQENSGEEESILDWMK